MKRLLLLALCCFLAAVSIITLDRRLYPLELREEIRMVPSKELAGMLCLDHRGFAADMFFIQVNLHSGSLMWKPFTFQFDSDWAYGMMDLVTELDPKYYMAYLFSAMGLIHNFSDVDRAQPIIERGMKIFPESWELPFWMGYGYHVYLEQYESASGYFWQAARKPDSPKTFLALILSSFRKGGAYEKAIWALSGLLESTEDENLKMVYTKKLVQLQNLSHLQQSALRFRDLHGQFPSDLNVLVSEGMLERIPDDPMGMRYIWDVEKNRVVVR
ncbi:MAG: hypothetical protein JXD19_11170 [Deltaproteobacteria bacterium]|nr:hypothetical protein [Deltaproteobacteria bacterium]